MKSITHTGKRDSLRFRSSTRERAFTKLEAAIKRHGLDYGKIAARLGASASSVELLVLTLNMSKPQFVERALKAHRLRLKRTGRTWKRKEHGLLSLEYYLCASYN